jgi:hypothetical protein
MDRNQGDTTQHRKVFRAWVLEIDIKMYLWVAEGVDVGALSNFMQEVLQEHGEMPERRSIIGVFTQAGLHRESVSERHARREIGEVGMLLERVFHCCFCGQAMW